MLKVGRRAEGYCGHPPSNEQNMNSAQYWIKLRLPYELDGLNMKQLTAVRKLVQGAFTAGKKDERKAKVTK